MIWNTSLVSREIFWMGFDGPGIFLAIDPVTSPGVCVCCALLLRTRDSLWCATIDCAGLIGGDCRPTSWFRETVGVTRGIEMDPVVSPGRRVCIRKNDEEWQEQSGHQKSSTDD